MLKKESEEAAPAATLLVHTLCLHCNSTKGPLRSRFYCLIGAQKKKRQRRLRRWCWRRREGSVWCNFRCKSVDLGERVSEWKGNRQCRRRRHHCLIALPLLKSTDAQNRVIRRCFQLRAWRAEDSTSSNSSTSIGTSSRHHRERAHSLTVAVSVVVVALRYRCLLFFDLLSPDAGRQAGR